MNTSANKTNILNTGTDYGFCPPLPSGEGWGEGFHKSANHDRPQYSYFFIRLLLPLAILLFSGCASVPEIKPATQSQSQVINYALSLQGVPYRYGKDSPEEGFDCSGFVKHVYQKQGINLPRTVKDMALSLPPVPKNNVLSGDLVFFNTNGNSFSHVGIYVNNDKFVHAPSQRTGKVLVSSLKNRYWQKHYVGARRPRRF